MDGCESLQCSVPPEEQHRPFPSSIRQARILRSIVRPATSLLPVADAKLAQRGPIRAQPVSHDRLHVTMSLQGFPDEFRRCLPIASFGHETFENLTLVVGGAPKAMALAVDLEEHLVPVAPPAAGPHALNAALADFGGEHRTEPVPPESYRFVADVDTPFVQQVLDVPQGKRIPPIHLHCQADDLGAGPEVAKQAGFGHHAKLRDRNARLKIHPSDRTARQGVAAATDEEGGEWRVYKPFRDIASATLGTLLAQAALHAA